MTDHALAALERTLRYRSAPRPPDLHGSRLNQTRRRQLIDHWWQCRLGRQVRRAPQFRKSQQEADALALGRFLPWIAAARAEAANVTRARKFQSAARRRARRA